MAFPWFKLHTEARIDAKLRSLTDAQFRTWFNLLCYAADRKPRGTIPEMDTLLLALEVSGGDESLLNETIVKLKRLKIISGDRDIIFIHFNERNYDSPSDMPNETRKRQKESREKRRANHNVTTCHDVSQNVTMCHGTDKIRLDKNRGEQITLDANASNDKLNTDAFNLSHNISEPSIKDQDLEKIAGTHEIHDKGPKHENNLLEYNIPEIEIEEIKDDNRNVIEKKRGRPANPDKPEIKVLEKDSFIEFCNLYPKRITGDQTAKNWNRRIKEGYKPEDLIKSVKCYNAELKKKGTGKEYIYESYNFLGEKAYFKGYLNGKVEENDYGMNLVKGLFGITSKKGSDDNGTEQSTGGASSGVIGCNGQLKSVLPWEFHR